MCPYLIAPKSYVLIEDILYIPYYIHDIRIFLNALNTFYTAADFMLSF